MSKSKDHPALLLNKDSYQWLAVQMKPQYINFLFRACGYTAENAYNVYKWKPDDPTYQKTEGEIGKKIMKIRERSNFFLRCCLLPCIRPYDSYCLAEYNK